MNSNIKTITVKNCYLCFSKMTDPDLARRVFISRYKQEPKEVKVNYQLLWVGPVPSAEIRDE